MGQRRKNGKGARVLGPYKHPRWGWQVVVVAEDGGRAPAYRPTEEEARALIRDLERELELEGPLTVQQAMDRYEVHQRAAGNSARSISTTGFRLRSLLDPVKGERLHRLSPARCTALYAELVARQAADTQRAALSETKTWARWCVEQRLLRASPWEGVKPTGKRRRGKEQLRVDEARRWLDKALELAAEDTGAVAAATQFLLGLRPGEVVARVGRDVDDEGRLLWVPKSKTPSGRRTLRVPEVLRDRLVQLAARAGAAGRLWPHERPWVLDQVRRVCRAAGVPEVTAQGMRGAHASLGLEGGVSAEAIAATLGHASTAITLAAYARPESAAAARQDLVLRVVGGGRAA